MPKKTHHYKHRATGNIVRLNDSFVRAFGEGAFERVEDDSTESADVAETNQPEAVVAAADQQPAAVAEPVAANPQNVTDNTVESA